MSKLIWKEIKIKTESEIGYLSDIAKVTNDFDIAKVTNDLIINSNHWNDKSGCIKKQDRTYWKITTRTRVSKFLLTNGLRTWCNRVAEIHNLQTTLKSIRLVKRWFQVCLKNIHSGSSVPIYKWYMPACKKQKQIKIFLMLP